MKNEERPVRKTLRLSADEADALRDAIEEHFCCLRDQLADLAAANDSPARREVRQDQVDPIISALDLTAYVFELSACDQATADDEREAFAERAALMHALEDRIRAAFGQPPRRGAEARAEDEAAPLHVTIN
jgi:hypothetical protein